MNNSALLKIKLMVAVPQMSWNDRPGLDLGQPVTIRRALEHFRNGQPRIRLGNADQIFFAQAEEGAEEG